MAKKIKLFPEPHVELRIHVSDEMIKDYQECRQMLDRGDDGKDCDTCSWENVKFFDTGMCELEEVGNKVMEENHEAINSR